MWVDQGQRPTVAQNPAEKVDAAGARGDVSDDAVPRGDHRRHRGGVGGSRTVYIGHAYAELAFRPFGQQSHGECRSRYIWPQFQINLENIP